MKEAWTLEVILAINLKAHLMEKNIATNFSQVTVQVLAG